MTTHNKTSVEFWKHKRLSEMSHDEWESLCDGCGRCCLHKLADEDDGAIYYTRAACALLDLTTCRCMDYSNRQQRMPDCVQISLEDVEYFNWLPASCAYRLLAEGEPLPQWHPLITGNPDSVAAAGISVSAIAQPAHEVENLADAVISLLAVMKAPPNET